MMYLRGADVVDEYDTGKKIEVVKESISACTFDQAREERQSFMKPIIESAEKGDAEAISIIERIFGDTLIRDYSKKCEVLNLSPSDCYCCSSGFAKQLGEKTSILPISNTGCSGCCH